MLSAQRMRTWPWKSPMRRTYYLALVALLVGLGMGAAWYLNAPRHRINANSLDSIREGMSEVEVIEVLGVEAGDYTTGHVAANAEDLVAMSIPPGSPKNWICNDYFMIVWF